MYYKSMIIALLKALLTKNLQGSEGSYCRRWSFMPIRREESLVLRLLK